MAANGKAALVTGGGRNIGRACVLATPQDARRALEISLAIERSLKTGAAVKLPLMP